MPRKIESRSLNASVYSLLNAIRNSQSYDYQNRVPVATQETLKDVGNAILTSYDLENAFLSALVNRIALVEVKSKQFNNALRRFKRGYLEHGEFIEEVFVSIAKAHLYDVDTAEKEYAKREIPDVDTYFHRINYKNFYKTTVEHDELRRAFLSEMGVIDLVARINESLTNGANYDEFVIMKNMIVDAVKNGKMYPVTIPEPNAENAHAIITEIKGISNSIIFPSTKYNAAGVLNFTPREKQVLILSAKFDAVQDVNVLASAFNMDKAEFMGMRVIIDDFADLVGVPAVLVSEDWWMIYDNVLRFEEFRNPQGMYWNYFLHVWKTFGISPFENAIVFTTETNAVTSVTVTPETAEVIKGNSLQMNATVATTGYISKDVIWSVEGAAATVSTINENGLLVVSINEANTNLTVTATSKADGSKKGTSTITVK